MTCAGIDYSHVRALDEDERAWLSQRAAGLRKRRIALGIGTALVPVLLFLPIALAVAVPWAPVLMLPTIWACLMLPLKWWDARKRTAFSLASAQAEEAEVFEGVPSVGALGESSLGRLMAAGLVLDERTPQRVDRLRDSGEAISLNGFRLNPPVWTDVADVAPAAFPRPEFPGRVPELAFVAPDADRRSLSEPELTELGALQPERESLRRNGCLLAFCAYFFLFAFAAADDAASLKWAVLALKAVALAYFGWRAFLALRERTRLRQDLAEGAVLRVLHEGKTLEVLPHLGLAWTYEGKPTPWRYAAQAKTRPPA